MPDGRFLSKSVAHSEQLGKVSMEADYLFMRCIPHLDRDGRMTGNPELVKAMVAPLRPEINAGLIPDLLRQLSDAGLVCLYSAAGKDVIEFPGFARHQKGMKYEREAASRFEPPPPHAPNPPVLTKSGPDPDEVRLSEVKSKSKLSSDAKASGAADAAPPVDNSVKGWLGTFMPMLRENGFEADPTDGSILKHWHKRGYTVDEVEAAIRGTALIRAAGGLKAFEGTKLSLRLLYARPKPGAPPERRPLWNEATEKFHNRMERTKRSDPMAGAQIATILGRIQKHGAA